MLRHALGYSGRSRCALDTADHLLTHSAGLDWDLDDIGTLAATPEDLPGNAQFLNDQPPARILPPGQHTLYSNAAYDLAGQMVEDVELSVKGLKPVHWYGKCGGDVPTPEEVMEEISKLMAS